MAKSQDRPRKQPKRKKMAKAQPGSSGTVTPSYQPPMRQVEIIKPKRKERHHPEPQDPNPPDEG